MGVIGRILGVGTAAQDVGAAVEGVAEVFTINKTKAELAARAQIMASMTQYSAEFSNAGQGWFDSLINGVNRLPRPIMALGTVGLFVFAMVDPISFAGRMEGLNYIPDPLWWLLGAIVSFYFGAREMHHFRESNVKPIAPFPPHPSDEIEPMQVSAKLDGNAALDEWRAQNIAA